MGTAEPVHHLNKCQARVESPTSCPQAPLPWPPLWFSALLLRAYVGHFSEVLGRPPHQALSVPPGRRENPRTSSPGSSLPQL